MKSLVHRLSSQKTITMFLLLVIIAVTITWLVFTPPGLNGKVRAIGYSVCHQMEDHTITIGEKYLPLCARCTGTFMGLVIPLSYLLSKGKKSGVPSKTKIIILVLFALLFAIDGVNSTLSELMDRPLLYEPLNWIRLATGLGFGIALGNLIIPLWNQTLWKESQPEAALHSWRQLGLLFLICVMVWGLILLDLPILFYPVALLSTLTIPLVLGMVYSLLWCIILKKENSLQQFRDGIRIFGAGLLTAMLQVGLIDLLRFLSTGTWGSLKF